MAEAFLDALKRVPDVQVLDDAAAMAPHLVDWRKRHRGSALGVALPRSTEAVAATVRLSAEHRVPIYPQGGNTSVCGGSVPGPDSEGIVVNLRRMNRVLSVDARDNAMIVEAGCVLADVQEAARSVDRLFPLSLGAEGSCQIGGNVATNAGGTAVLRYGNTRDLVLGLEAVLADGTVWDGLRTLRKNNSGYDLKNLFIGSEGTLGIVTAAALKLFPRPRHIVTALIGIASIDDALTLAETVQDAFPGAVSALELLSASELDLVIRHVPGSILPLSAKASWYVLVEIDGAESEDSLSDRLTGALEGLMASKIVSDAVVAASERQRQQLWFLRHHVTEANVKEGMGITHDVAVPLARIPDFVRRAEAALASAFPSAFPVVVGHLGDGNLHYIAMFSHAVWATIPDQAACADAVGHLIYEIAADLRGTFSAEHGIGSIHLSEMARYKSPVELTLMKRIKGLLDPNDLMNPGRVLPR